MIFASLMFNAAGPAYATANVYVSPSQVFVGVGQNFNVDIAVSDVQNLYGWEFTLNWSSTFLGAVNVAEGPFLRSLGQTFFSSNTDNTLGHMIVDCTLLGNVGSANGSGVLATLTFNVKAAGQSILDLYDATLLDSSYPDPQIIACSLTGGYWVSSQQHEVAVTAVTFSPSAVLPGQTVAVNVSVADQGDYVEDFNVTAFVDSQVIGEQTVHLNSGSSTVLFFSWNTTGFGKGEHWLLASADVVPGEINTTDNNKTAASPAIVLTPAHDVAVTDFEPSKTIVGEGFCMFINVSARDFGIFSETFNVTSYANSIALRTDSVTLTSGEGVTWGFMWNTTGFALGNFIIQSYATPVDGETNTTDNTFIFGQIAIGKKGDISSIVFGVPEGRVDMRDIAAVARPFGTHLGDALWYSNADISGTVLGIPDNTIDMRDVSIVARNFGT